MATRISFFLFLLFIKLVSSELVPEDGYTVSTIFDGNKLRINPRSALPRPGTDELFILDSVNSVFYTVPFPISHDAQIKPLSGDGVAGYSDGNSASSRFNRPRSFAVDLRGNVYVADKNNHVIRKISESGVTTIAGGYSQQTGKVDGPALNASFSNDFEVSFVPQGCALLICDHGNQLIRQINLKPEDCGSGSKPVLGTSLVAGGVGVLCLLIGLLIGFAVRPCVTSCTGRSRPSLFQQDMEALPNQSGEASSDSLLRHQKRNC